jgi:predicted transcriptional regulator
MAGSDRRAVTMKKNVRVSLDLSPSLDGTLSRLAIELGCTRSEVLRKAITLLKVAVDGKGRGRKIGLADQGTRLDVEILI